MLRRRLLAPLVLLLLAPAASPGDTLSEPARWLRHYLTIDSTTPAGEAAAATFLADLFHRAGLPTRLLVSPEGHTSLYARLEAPEPTAGALVLLHHLDVVPAGPGWTVEPFGGTVRDGRLYGRGAIDIKSLGIAHLAAFLEAAEDPTSLTRDVIFLAVADEERGGLQGTGWILERHGDLFDGAAAVLGEGGANKVVGERPIWAGIEIAQKRPLWLRATARGRGGHGSSMILGSAPHQLIRGLTRIVDLPREFRVTEAVRIYARALAPLHNEQVARVLADLDAHVTSTGPADGVSPGIYSLLLDTVQVTVLDGSEKINVIPAEASAEIDVRLLPDSDGEAFLERLREAAGPRVDLEVLLTAPPAPPSPVDHPVYRAVAGVLDDDAPVVPAFIPGFTDSRFFRQRGIPAYGVSPFYLESRSLPGIHGPDEWIALGELDRGVERMKRIVSACVTADGTAPGTDSATTKDPARRTRTHPRTERRAP